MQHHHHTPPRGGENQNQLVLLMTIASKRISKCNYVSSYELHEDERTKATWVLCTRRPGVNVCVCVCLKFYAFVCICMVVRTVASVCNDHMHSGEYMEMGCPNAAERFFSTLCCLWNFEHKTTTKQNKRENWIERVSCVRWTGQKRWKEREKRTFGCNAVCKECIKKDYNFCLFTCTN